MDNLDLVPKQPTPGPSSTARELLHHARSKMSAAVPNLNLGLTKHINSPARRGIRAHGEKAREDGRPLARTAEKKAAGERRNRPLRGDNRPLAR